ncbi:FAD binding domain-containing protein [Mycena alexandri]|uniref:FAD binding domain-containing protein n=1 Tax=Mycena alexandri TaxID=1745969 RepID=A0AAD6X157_9AGAR|nr:FAD binding domain-containing protein [Mycena alexandri]
MATTPSVLVVGAGPAGLILAIILRQNGIAVRIIDKEQTYRSGSRGSAIQPRTLELYDILGVLPAIRSVGEPIPPMAKYEPGEISPTSTVRISEWVDPTPDVPHSNALNLNQDDHEGILRAHLQTLSCSVELGSELRKFEHFSDRVVAHIVKTDSEGNEVEETTTFGWLVGTDGAHSVVRKQLGFSFLGETRTEQQIALGDIIIEEGVKPGLWHMWSVPPKMIVLRSSDSTSKKFMFAYTGRPEHVAGKAMTRDEFIQDFYALTGRNDVKFGPATWLSNYRPNLRMVDRMRDGRVFIAGDAAHCHSPTGGQGLNSSVQDAANLGWKLALAQKGVAAPALLDSYSEERLRVIAQMLQLTTELFHKTFDPLNSGDKSDDSGWKRGPDMAMLGVNYCGSSIVQEEPDAVAGSAYLKAEGGRVQAAYRALDASGLIHSGSEDTPTTLFSVFRASSHTVLLFGSDAPTRAQIAEAVGQFPTGLVRMVEVLPQGHSSGDVTGSVLILQDREGHAYKGYKLQPDEFTVVVVRPDGVVGAVARSAEGVKRYFQKIMM